MTELVTWPTHSLFSEKKMSAKHEVTQYAPLAIIIALVIALWARRAIALMIWPPSADAKQSARVLLDVGHHEINSGRAGLDAVTAATSFITAAIIKNVITNDEAMFMINVINQRSAFNGSVSKAEYDRFFAIGKRIPFNVDDSVKNC